LNFVDPTGLFLRDSDGFGEEEAIPIGLGVVFGAGLAYTLATTTFASGVGTSTAAVGSGAAGLAASGGGSLLDSYGGNIFAAGGNAIAATLAPQGPLSVSTEAARQVRSSPGSSSSVPSAGRTLPNQWAPIQEQLSSVLAPASNPELTLYDDVPEPPGLRGSEERLAAGQSCVFNPQACLLALEQAINQAAIRVGAAAGEAAATARGGVRAAVRAASILIVLEVPSDSVQVVRIEGYTDKVGKVAEEVSKTLGKKVSPGQVKGAIHRVKEGLGRGGAVRNPDVLINPKTGDVIPKTHGGAGDSIGNIFDFL
jgi:hypothetical protein